MSRPVYLKLGLKEDVAVIVVDPPKPYDQLVEYPPFEITSHVGKEPCKFIHLFCAFDQDLEANFPLLIHALSKDGMLWVSWPKATSRLSKNINENDIRDFGLKMGLVDVKVCAIDADWSGLKFMFRKKDR